MSFSVSRNKPTKDDPHFIARNLSAAGADVTYSVSQQFAEMHVDKHTLETSHSQFDVRAYADADLCVMRAKENIYQHLQTHWYSRDETFEHHIENGWFEVTWQGHELDLLILTLPGRHHTVRTCWLASESLQTNEAFLREVVCWNTETRGEVLVYNDDTWQKDKHLLQEIKTATLENLVLAPGLKEELISDLSTFFASRQHYERYGAPWKRGLLLVGPPGNGKTHAVKALINKLNKPCLYVRSLSSDQNDNTHNSIRNVFDRARIAAPCILVLEDLDSLVTDKNRSVFLNEMDGFTSNTGIVTLATSNHPEKLDPALAERPSRFDRKYQFDLPAQNERHSYLAMWNASLQTELQLTAADTDSISALTEGFSFAHLKELIVSSVTAWMNANEARPASMGVLMTSQAALLRTQMTSQAAKSAEKKRKKKVEQE